MFEKWSSFWSNTKYELPFLICPTMIQFYRNLITSPLRRHPRFDRVVFSMVMWRSSLQVVGVSIHAGAEKKFKHWWRSWSYEGCGRKMFNWKLLRKWQVLLKAIGWSAFFVPLSYQRRILIEDSRVTLNTHQPFKSNKFVFPPKLS